MLTGIASTDYISSYYTTESLSSSPYAKREDKPKFKTANIPMIKGIYPQIKKRLVVVKFEDNSIVKLNCHEEDEFNVEVATALAIAYKVYGAKGEFRRQVKNLSKGE